MDKDDVVHVYTKEYYLAIRKDEMLPFETIQLDLEIIMLSKISQTEKAESLKFHSCVGYKTESDK